MMRPFRGVRKTEKAVIAAKAAAISAMLAASGCGAPERAVAGRARPVEVPGEGYVSSDACRTCHPSQYASWHASYHRTMTQVATPQTVATSFDGVTVAAIPGEPIRLEQHGDQLQAEFVDPDGGGRITRMVVMTTGSHNQQIYWYATGNGRMLGQLPTIWLIGERTWIPRRSAIMAPPSATHYSETGAWNGVCLDCHATRGQPRLDAPFGTRPIADQTGDTRAAEFGIACEACHGPAGAHAAANRNPLRRYALHFSRGADSTIVQPARLDPRRASQVCGQCHSFWEFSDARAAADANAHGLPYRPGDDLAATRFIVQPTRNGDTSPMRALLATDADIVRDVFWSDGMIRATGREYNGLLDSPCYARATSAGRTMTCFSCHTMHKASDDPRPLTAWADDQLSARAIGNAACAACHQMPTAHSHHQPKSSGASCENCHMPYTTYGLLKTIRSHQISSPSVQATIETGRPNACNLCHLDKTLGWAADALEEWYGAPRPELGQDDETVAAAVLWLLKGDAGQRAIVAQAMGWRAAQETGGASWLAPYLALTGKDQYDAVRLIASRSLASLPSFDRAQLPRDAPQLLIKSDGTFDADRVNRIVRDRNNRRLVYRE
jgi:hypothetical protein